MLVLARKIGERILVRSLAGDEIWIEIEKVTNGVVHLGITAPPEFLIDREEVAKAKALSK